MKLFRMVFVLTLFCASWVLSQNLISNPSFESGATGWTLQVDDGKATANWASTDTHGGDQAARISVTQAASENWKIQLQVPRFAATAGSVYTLRFWAKANAAASLHLATQKGATDSYEYISGIDVNLTTAWKQYEVSYTAPATGNAVFVWNIYVGAATGVYDFDDFSVTAESGALPTALSAPTVGARTSGKYRNLFLEMGKKPADIDAKVLSMFQQLFENTNEDERLYWDFGSDKGYVKAIDSDDIRSEGMSYGMMIAVQLDKKDLFDKLWRFSYDHMRHADGPRQGAFAWQVTVNGTTATKKDPNSAPDGEEYFALALLFAEARWGNGTGILNYGKEARDLLDVMLRLETRNGGVVDGLTNFFDAEARQVVFVPQGANAEYTDPSYHLPTFYRIWGEAVTADKTLWNAIVDTSAAFLLRAQNSTSGLVPDYMTFAGTPKTTDFNNKSHTFAYDSWRVAMNVGMDAHLNGVQTWHQTFMNQWLQFFRDQGANYKSLFSWEGVPEATENYSSEALIAMNAVGVLASENPADWTFVQDFWNTPMATGTYRYYKGLLQMLAWLHCSGKFVAWGYGADPVSVIPAKPTGRTLSLKPLQGKRFDLLGRQMGF